MESNAVAPQTVSIDDFGLPRSLVVRIAKAGLPPSASIQKDALRAVAESSTVFIGYLCSLANESAHHQGRKGISAKDITRALHATEYEEFIPRIEAELNKFEAAQKVTAPKGSQKAAEVRVADERSSGGQQPEAPNVALHPSKKTRLDRLPEPDASSESDTTSRDESVDGSATNEDEESSILSVGENDEDVDADKLRLSGKSHSGGEITSSE